MDSKARALACIAGALVTADPSRARQLAADAEEVARSSRGAQSGVLGFIAEAVAVTDPGRAERIAQSITENYWKVVALASVAEAVAVADL
jgi:hypothetical protein